MHGAEQNLGGPHKIKFQMMKLRVRKNHNNAVKGGILQMELKCMYCPNLLKIKHVVFLRACSKGSNVLQERLR